MVYRRWLAAICASAITWAPAGAGELPAIPPSKTLGLVLTVANWSVRETPKNEECPNGFNVPQSQNYDAQFPEKAAAVAHQKKYGFAFGNRGPAGESIFYFPLAAEDKLPFRMMEGKVAQGIDLDGKTGQEDFTSPDGRRGVDNELLRATSCIKGMRTRDAIHSATQTYIRRFVYNRYIVEISEVDDLTNDPHVVVRTYRGLDSLSFDARDQARPWATQRIDETGTQRYNITTKGRIENGVLITEPVDARLPMLTQFVTASDQSMTGMVFRLKLDGTGAEGQIGGYANIDSWFLWLSKGWGMGPIADTTTWSPPSLYRAMLKLADGPINRTTKKRDSISSALDTKFVWTFVKRSNEQVRPVQVAESR